MRVQVGCPLFKWTDGRKALAADTRGGTGWLTESDGDERGPDDKEAVELSSASFAIGGVGRRIWTGVDG